MPARRRRRQPGCACSAQHAIIPGTARALALRGSRGRGEGTGGTMPRDRCARDDNDPECRRTGCPAASSPLHPRVPNHHHRRCARYHDSSPFARLGGDRRVSSTWLGATGTNQLTDESYKQQWSPQTCQQPSSRMNPVCNLQTQMVLISASQPRR
jgi:hypothetical protein